VRPKILSAIVGALVLTTSGAGSAQTTDTPASIQEAELISELSTRDPRVAGIAGRIAAARADVTTARARPNPSISLEREEPFVDGSGSPTNYLRLSLPLDLSGRRGLQIGAAEASVRAAASDGTQTALEIVVAGLRLFDDAARARMQVELLTDARASLARAVEIARQRAKAGDASGYEVQRFELELAAHDDELASAQIELHRGRAQLGALLGRPGELDAASTLDVPGSVPVLDELLASASERADLRSARLRGESASRRARAAGRGWVPTPTVMAGAVTQDLGDRTGTGYVVGLGLSIPVFDRGNGEAARARAEQLSAAAEARWLERQIPATVRVAHATLLARIEQARRLGPGQLERLDVILRAAETAFREGNASVVELLDAHRAARGVRTRALELRHQVARDKHELELALGHLLRGRS
jgi:cobalt-zinc-cadmium efflux system outer membrane protein